MKTLGKKVDIAHPFVAPEGEANLYSGMIGSGKTYGATADVIDLVKKGRLVYVTWPISLDNFDDRKSFIISLRNFLLFKKYYYEIECPKNLHFINAETGEVDGVYTFDPEKPSAYIEYLNKLNHCDLFIDEAWRVIDSYKGTNFSLDSRNLILVTRHKYRTVNLIAQRPTSIHVTARGNMNRFYIFKKITTWPLVRFARYEYQEMANETVDETKPPLSVKKYWASKKIFNAYNSYFYGNLNPMHKIYANTYELSFKDRFYNLIVLFFSPILALRQDRAKKIFTKLAAKSLGGSIPRSDYKEGERLNTIPSAVEQTLPF